MRIWKNVPLCNSNETLIHWAHQSVTQSQEAAQDLQDVCRRPIRRRPRAFVAPKPPRLARLRSVDAECHLDVHFNVLSRIKTEMTRRVPTFPVKLSLCHPVLVHRTTALCAFPLCVCHEGRKGGKALLIEITFVWLGCICICTLLCICSGDDVRRFQWILFCL